MWPQRTIFTDSNIGFQQRHWVEFASRLVHFLVLVRIKDQHQYFLKMHFQLSIITQCLSVFILVLVLKTFQVVVRYITDWNPMGYS